MKIYVGTSGFSYKEWKGTFYPEKVSPKELLRYYSEQLNTVEINNTFYHMPNGTVLTSWAGQVGGDFVFSIKAPQVITHIKRLRQVSSETGYLFKSLSVLKKKLGPVLFQFPKSFHADPDLLRSYLDLIPRGSLCAFEFRSPTWRTAEVIEMLREKGCSLCVADSDEEPVEEIVTAAPWGYLRLRRSDYSDADLNRWADAVHKERWEKAFVYFKHEDDSAKGPQLAIRFQELVDPRGIVLKKAG